MGLTREQAKELSRSLADVFTPEGDAGVIDRLYTFSDPAAALYGKGQCALVVGQHVHGWYPISVLDSSETLKEHGRNVTTGTELHVFKYPTHAVTVTVHLRKRGDIADGWATGDTIDGGEMATWWNWHYTNAQAEKFVADEEKMFAELDLPDCTFAVVWHKS